MELNHTTQREADERALFEAWAKRHGHDVVSRLETGGKIYVSSFTRHAWAIWQARAALAQSEAPAPALPTNDEVYAEVQRLRDEHHRYVSTNAVNDTMQAVRSLLASPVAAPEALTITALRLQAAAANPDLVKVKPVAAPEAPASEQQAAVQIQHDVWGVYHKPTGKWVKDRDGRIELLSKQNAKNICINDEYEARHLRIEIHLAIPAATTASASIDQQIDTLVVTPDERLDEHLRSIGLDPDECEAAGRRALDGALNTVGTQAQQTECMQPSREAALLPKPWREALRDTYPNMPLNSVKPLDALTWAENEIAELRAALARAQTKKD